MIFIYVRLATTTTTTDDDDDDDRHNISYARPLSRMDKRGSARILSQALMNKDDNVSYTRTDDDGDTTATPHQRDVNNVTLLASCPSLDVQR